MRKYCFVYLIALTIFYSCEKDPGKVTIKALVKEYYTNLPMDSFQFHFGDERCSYLSLGTRCKDDTIILSDENGSINFSFDQCCHSEMILYKFNGKKRLAKSFDVDLSEISELDSIKSCNGIRIDSNQDYEFTITVKPYIDLKVKTKDTTFVSYDIPEFNMFNMPVNNNWKVRESRIYLKKLVGRFEIFLNKLDSTKKMIDRDYDAYKMNSLEIYFE
jgi:hypothetical protein